MLRHLYYHKAKGRKRFLVKSVVERLLRRALGTVRAVGGRASVS